MKTSIYIIILSVVIFSCKSKENEISGTWVEITDNYRPVIFVFDQDSVVSLYGFNKGYKEDYKIWGNKLTFSIFDVEWKYKIAYDTLKFFNVRNNSLIHQFIRNDSFKIRSLISDRYNVHLPEAKNMKLSRWEYDKDHIFVLSDIDNDSVPELHINGDKFVLDSLLYSKIIRLSNVEYSYFPINLLFVDRSVKVRYLKILEKELQKAGLRKVCYVLCDENELNQATMTLPAIEFNYPDSLKGYLPPPPPPEIKSDVYCHFRKDNILLNNAVFPFDSLKNRMFHEFTKGNNPALEISFDQGLNYEQYIHYFIKIQHIYYQARDDYALKKYNCKNFTQGCQNYNAEAMKIRDEVIQLYRMNILMK